MIICDCHCDTLYSMQMGRDQHLDVTMENLRTGGVSLQTMAMYVGPGRKGDVEALMQGMLQKLELLKSQGWKQVDDPSQAVDGEVAVMLSIEGCEPFDPACTPLRNTAPTACAWRPSPGTTKTPWAIPP